MPEKGAMLELPALREILLLAIIGFQPPPELLLGNPDRLKMIQQADEILAPNSKATVPEKVQALSIKGRHYEAMVLYAEWVRNTQPGEQGDLLMLLLRNNPAVKKEDVDRRNPFEGERLYGQGIRLYFQGDFASAEKLLQQSTEADNQDARVYYFLGLSRLAQGKQEPAYDSFEFGARLERSAKPGKAAINTSLERVQGPERRILGQVRDRIER